MDKKKRLFPPLEETQKPELTRYEVGDVFEHHEEAGTYFVVTLVTDTGLNMARLNITQPANWQTLHANSRFDTFDFWNAQLENGKWLLRPKRKQEWK